VIISWTSSFIFPTHFGGSISDQAFASALLWPITLWVAFVCHLKIQLHIQKCFFNASKIYTFPFKMKINSLGQVLLFSQLSLGVQLVIKLCDCSFVAHNIVGRSCLSSKNTIAHSKMFFQCFKKLYISFKDENKLNQYEYAQFFSQT
jgi:hypothetical protein